MDKRDLACSPDLGLMGCPMGSQDTMELFDRINKMDQACFPDLGLVGHPKVQRMGWTRVKKSLKSRSA